MEYIFTYWLIYAFFGWIIETIYTSVPAGELQDRGFLSLPIIPIYGFGALIVAFLLQPLSSHPLMIFISGIIATSALEYATSYLMEKLFNMRWWDYSQQKYNIHGRICIKNSLLFGLLSIALVEIIHPMIHSFVDPLNPVLIRITSLIFLFMVSLDTIHATIFSLEFSKVSVEIRELRASLASARGDARHELEKSASLLREKVTRMEHRLVYKYPSLKFGLLSKLDDFSKDLINANKKGPY